MPVLVPVDTRREFSPRDVISLFYVFASGKTMEQRQNDAQDTINGLASTYGKVVWNPIEAIFHPSMGGFYIDVNEDIARAIESTEITDNYSRLNIRLVKWGEASILEKTKTTADWVSATLKKIHETAIDPIVNPPPPSPATKQWWETLVFWFKIVAAILILAVAIGIINSIRGALA
ncbi:MAG: hypothetical protein WC530_07905 [Candidatus Omnitrophota bacterium]|jgi:hypothetical protein